MANRCDSCDKGFESEESLNQHNLAKHTGQQKIRPTGSGKSGKKYGLLVAVILIVAISGAYFGLSQSSGYIVLSEYSEHTKGTGQVEVIEYSDFQCPACGAAYPEVKNILNQAGDKIKFVYKHFPLTSIHPYAFKAAEASECAADQGKFWEYHDKVFENQNKLDVRSLKKYAQQTGLNTDLFNKCLDSGAMSPIVRSDIEEAKSKGVKATPTFFVNGQKHEGVINLATLLQISSL